MDDRRIALNLLVLSDKPPGGTGYYAIALFEALATAAERADGRFAVIGFARDGVQHLIPAWLHPLMRWLPHRGRLSRVVNEWVRLPAAMRRERIDTLINPAFLGPVWGARRCAIVIHDVYFRSVPGMVPLRRRWLLRTMVPWLARRSDTVIVDSEATRRDLSHFYPDIGRRALVVYPASRLRAARRDPASRAEETGRERPFLLMVGHLTANKDPGVVIAAMALLRARGVQVDLVHIGDDLGRLAGLAATVGLSDRVHALGPQSDAVLADHYVGCLATILASHHEGFGLPLLEAQQAGAPVIASTAGALPEVGGAAAIYFDVTSPQQCADAIAMLAQDPDERQRRRDQGRDNAARFSWSNTADTLLTALGVRSSAQTRPSDLPPA